MRIIKNPAGWVVLSILPLASSCGEDPAPDPGDSDGLPPEAAFSALEERLTSAQELQIDFHVAADGAVVVELDGTLRAEPGNTLELSASGNFAGQDVELFVQSDGIGMEYGRRADPSRDAAPGYLSEAVVIGLTRMGILHNLARLVGGAPPDGGEGGVRDWVVVDSITRVADPTGEEAPGSFHFVMHVSGTRAGFASLEVDDSGLPTIRRQTVHFPDGDMRVVEEYRNVRIDP